MFCSCMYLRAIGSLTECISSFTSSSTALSLSSLECPNVSESSSTGYEPRIAHLELVLYLPIVSCPPCLHTRRTLSSRHHRLRRRSRHYPYHRQNRPISRPTTYSPNSLTLTLLEQYRSHALRHLPLNPSTSFETHATVSRPPIIYTGSSIKHSRIISNH